MRLSLPVGTRHLVIGTPPRPGSMGAAGIVLFAGAISWSQPARAQDHRHDEQLGTVHFQTSCAPEAASRFDRAVALLHSFEFGAATRGFNDVITADSTCAIAYWGIALSQWANPFIVAVRPPAQLGRGHESIERGTLAGPKTARERDYLAAAAQLYTDYESRSQRSRVVAYENAMRALALRYPSDTEATIFHALSLLAAASPTDKTYADQIEATNALTRLLASEPNHPGLTHYLIHGFDAPALASRGVDAARRYGAIAPSAPHALHMPSHIFTRVGAWDESIETNLRARAVAQRLGSVYEALHSSDYSVYAYLQTGRTRAAEAIRDSVGATADAVESSSSASGASAGAAIFARAAIPARVALERQNWTDAVALQTRSTTSPWADALTYFARALGGAHTGDTVTMRVAIDSLASIRDRLTRTNEPYWAEQVEIQRLGATAWQAWAAHHPNSALAVMREAAVREDATEKNAVTPGPLAPARELLGDLLSAVNRPADALVEYRATLEKEPRRLHALRGAASAASRSGNRTAAAEYSRALRALCKHADHAGCR